MGTLPDDSSNRAWMRSSNGKSTPISLDTLQLIESQPIVAVQNYCTEEQVSIGVSAVMFAQGFGPALFLSFAQTIFSNSLKHEIPHYAPEVDVQSVINAGATGFREIVAPASLRGVIDAYNKSGNDVFYLITAAAVAVFVFGWGMGWKSVKKTKGEKGEASDVAEV